MLRDAILILNADREEAKKEDEEFQLNDDYSEDEAEWGDEAEWQNEAEDAEDVKDESSAYLDFLNEEAQKLGTALEGEDDDSDLDEESLLETPLDEIEPYSLLKTTLLRKSYSCHSVNLLS